MSQLSTNLMRSALYLPGSNARAIEKARNLAADAVIFDLEDAVAAAEKPEARRNLEKAFERGMVARGLNVVRTNSHGTADFAADLDTARRCRPHAILVPKVSRPGQVDAICRELDAKFGAHRPALWCMIETADGVLAVAQIASARHSGSRAIECLVVGTNDIARETGVSMENGRQHMHPWLMTVVLAAKANGLVVLDGVFNDFKDAEGFNAEAAQARMMGFDGKTLIHPTQLEPANRVFAPSPEAVEEAREIVAAFSDPANAGRGVINLAGRMVELLHLEMARRLIDKDAAIRARGSSAY